MAKNKKQPQRPSIPLLKYLYTSILVVIFAVIIATPRLIKSNISFLDEEVFEGLLIAVLLLLGFFIIKLYNREMEKISQRLAQELSDKRSMRERLDDAFKYIGQVNVQIDVISSIYTEQSDYPDNKKAMKQTIKFLAEKAISIIPTEWVLLRIINTENQNTLREYIATRGSAAIIKHEIPNRDLSENKNNPNYSYITTTKNNLTLKAYCIFPQLNLTNEQKILLRAVVDQLEMLYLIFESRFYKYQGNNNH